MVKKTDLYPGCRVISLVDDANGVLVGEGCGGTVIRVSDDDFIVLWDSEDITFWCSFNNVALELPDDNYDESCAIDVDIYGLLFNNTEDKT